MFACRYSVETTIVCLPGGAMMVPISPFIKNNNGAFTPSTDTRAGRQLKLSTQRRGDTYYTTHSFRLLRRFSNSPLVDTNRIARGSSFMPVRRSVWLPAGMITPEPSYALHG